jgi:hypothetical protein
MNDCPLRRPLADLGDRRAAAACSLLAPNAARRSLSSGSGGAALIKRGGPPCRETSRLEAYVIRKSDGFKQNYRFLRRGREVNTTALMALDFGESEMVGRSREKGLAAVGVMGVGLPPTTPLVDCKAMPVHVFMPQPIAQGAAQRGRPAANGPQPASRRPARRAFRLWPADRPASDSPSRWGHYPPFCHRFAIGSLDAP